MASSPNAPRLRLVRSSQDTQLLAWPAPLQQLLPVLDAQLDLLDREPSRAEPVRNFMLLVQDSTGNYNGLLPASGHIGSNVRQPYVICWFNEEHRDTAFEKIKLAYDFGPDTNPAP